MLPLYTPDMAGMIAAPALPFVMVDADVTQEILGGHNATAAGSWAGAARRLLHGMPRPSKYSTCSVCTLNSCKKDTKIYSGHCKMSLGGGGGDNPWSKEGDGGLDEGTRGDWDGPPATGIMSSVGKGSPQRWCVKYKCK